MGDISDNPNFEDDDIITVFSGDGTASGDSYRKVLSSHSTVFAELITLAAAERKGSEPIIIKLPSASGNGLLFLLDILDKLSVYVRDCDTKFDAIRDLYESHDPWWRSQDLIEAFLVADAYDLLAIPGLANAMLGWDLDEGPHMRFALACASDSTENIRAAAGTVLFDGDHLPPYIELYLETAHPGHLATLREVQSAYDPAIDKLIGSLYRTPMYDDNEDYDPCCRTQECPESWRDWVWPRRVIGNRLLKGLALDYRKVTKSIYEIQKLGRENIKCPLCTLRLSCTFAAVLEGAKPEFEALADRVPDFK